MKTWIRLILVCALPLILGGCIENAMLVTLNPDGSGTLTVRLLSGTEMSDFAEAGEGSLKDAISDPEQFGEGVELVSVKEVTNKNGWKGAMATFSFTDIEKLRFQPTEMEQENETGSESMTMGNDIQFRFEFAPGSPATLTVHPEIKGQDAAAAEAPIKAGSEEDPFASAGLDESDDAPGMAAGMDEMGDQMAMAMMAGMAPMMKGMRISYLLKINGEIKETNAKHRPQDNTIVVLDMKVDQLLADKSLFDKLSGGVENMSALANMDLPAFKMQDPKTPLVVTFD